MFPILETERLLLREIIEKDADAIYQCFSNEEVMKYYGQTVFTELKQAQTMIEFFASHYKERKSVRWGIELKEAPGLIGTIGLNNLLEKYKRAEIGYELHPDYWRSGYISEALKEVLSYAFQELDLQRIGAIVFLENKASNHLLTKLGFQKEGVLRDYIYQDGLSYDTNVFSLLKKEFIK